MLASAVVAPCSTASTTGSSMNGSECMDHIDLKVTKQELNLVEWSFRRNEIPIALARRGITLQEWKVVFDKCDRLWRKRNRELHEIDEARNRYFLRDPAMGQILTSFWTLLLVGLFMWGMVMLAIMSGWLLFMGISFLLAISDHMIYFPKYFYTMANYEKDWSQLADEQSCVFQSHADVAVEQLQEIVLVHGRKPTWTVGLRFRFEDATTGGNWIATSGDNDDDNDNAVHDLERLLELNQYGAPGNVQREEEYHRLKTRLMQKLSQNQNAPRPSPHVVTAMAMVVTDDENNNHHEGYDEKKSLLDMV
jgi:hypothetical protein